MAGAKSHKPLPVAEWPELDREVWRNANEAGDEFLDRGSRNGRLIPRERWSWRMAASLAEQ
jgi:hypothetical protein